jgi:imidazolonepropionase-like amidohydrolase
MGLGGRILGALALALLGTGTAEARDLVIHAGRLLDGVSKTPQINVSILIHDDRITGVQSGFVSPKGFTVVDLSKATVLPGLIDCHVHVTSQFDGGNPVAEAVTETDYDSAVKSTAYARATLLAGFTSVRDVGAATGVVVALKRAIAKGIVDGPRMWVSGSPLGPTGGHNDAANGLDPALSNPEWKDNIVNSPEDARRVVREHRREGVDLIKIMPSGGVLSIGDDPNLQLMTDDEIKAVIEDASGAAQSVLGGKGTGGGPAHPKKPARRLCGRREDRLRHRSGPGTAWPERAGIRADGPGGDDADGRHHRGDRLGRRSHR